MFNETILIGNVGQDAQTGDGWARISVATNESWKDKDGDWQDRTTWHNVFFRGKLAERAGKLEKGDKVLVKGIYNNHKEKERQSEMHLNGSYFRNLNPKSQGSDDQAPSEKKEKGGDDDLPF